MKKPKPETREEKTQTTTTKESTTKATRITAKTGCKRRREEGINDQSWKSNKKQAQTRVQNTVKKAVQSQANVTRCLYQDQCLPQREETP